MARLLEGKPIAEKIKESIRQAITVSSTKPVLASILVGDNAGAQAYVKSQTKTAESLGIVYQLHALGQQITETQLIEVIQKLNADTSVHGIIVQMP
ncbi:MAG: bifunctional 5,10-methylenetetrahydrofolate dehydrogenase/5,10-methenyltetrahydrofolate cyclohydrolase, partial [Candidatus Omnitrophica bacterium]|nr:bifunctional 5,10-methylenetetrahydrofolate dehydrogenase/5,10-methenyltetrahydrofolate cyclohydrolase [Candidatus Omnitrophota bacterium]